MTTVVRLAKRAEGLGVAEFQSIAADAADWSRAAAFGAHHARQSLTLPGGYRRGEPVFDVVDELVFADEDSTAACLADVELAGAWTPEHLDRASIATLVVDEHVAKAGDVSSAGVKSYEVVTMRPDLERAEFDRYWREVHGPLAAGISGIRRYVQDHLAPGFRDSGAAPFDGLAVTWFDDVAGMRDGVATAVYRATRADEANFLAGELPFIITTERIIPIGSYGPSTGSRTAR